MLFIYFLIQNIVHFNENLHIFNEISLAAGRDFILFFGHWMYMHTQIYYISLSCQIVSMAFVKSQTSQINQRGVSNCLNHQVFLISHPDMILACELSSIWKLLGLWQNKTIDQTSDDKLVEKAYWISNSSIGFYERESRDWGFTSQWIWFLSPKVVCGWTWSKWYGRLMYLLRCHIGFVLKRAWAPEHKLVTDSSLFVECWMVDDSTKSELWLATAISITVSFYFLASIQFNLIYILMDSFSFVCFSPSENLNALIISGSRFSLSDEALSLIGWNLALCDGDQVLC